MLDAYLQQFNQLIQAPSSPIPLIAAADATAYINIARLQVASEGECVRAMGALTFASGTQAYQIGTIAPSGLGTGGIADAISVRLGMLEGNELDIRPWEYFWPYYLSAGPGTPIHVGQQGQGQLGTLYFSPIPNAALTAVFDAAWLPDALAVDADPEAIPYPWTDAVPFYAAWLGMQSVQRQADADMMMQRYEVLMRRARGESTPSVLPGNLPGDIGAKLAAAKTSLTQAVQSQGGR